MWVENLNIKYDVDANIKSNQRLHINTEFYPRLYVELMIFDDETQNYIVVSKSSKKVRILQTIAMELEQFRILSIVMIVGI